MGRTIDEAESARARREQRDERIQDRAALRYVLGHALGRRFVRRLIYDDLGLQANYCGDDAPGLLRLAGRRDIASRLLSRIRDLDPDQWDLALTEEIEAKRQRRTCAPPTIDDIDEIQTED